MYICIIYRRQKNEQAFVHLAYIFNAFFSFWGDLGALVGTLCGFVSVGDWSSPGNISKVVSQRSRAIVSDDLGLSTPQ